MKRTVLIPLAVAMIASVAAPLRAERLKVVTTYPYIASIVEQIAKDTVRVDALARGDYDPHTIVPKPSFIAKLRKAHLLIINGAQLEIGWLPPLLKQANNASVNPGTRGFLDLSGHVTLIDVPKSVSRAQGDVHPDGNPHYYIDPHVIPRLARAICTKLSEVDSRNAAMYKKNYDEFAARWKAKRASWDAKLRRLKGAKVIQYHKNMDYLLIRYGLVRMGTVEPLPGIPPTSKHIAELEKIFESNTIRFILQDVYNADDSSRHLSKKFGVKMVKVPHDVGAVREAEGIFSLFDEMVRRLTQ
ncbi:MAG TPA: zinc ABC transporter substrate-binding protein [Spirochaetota bacterium]|nr:zinc ABC transporter substrate-binding protein [Spirochaetota bacterium]HOS39050.1 zinc ABC transporter substrate-binding protein [Spirochaetota bacterium]HPI21692.1 zinc ABC transporter substrate-binding protein [Spirochaetota bacterium]HPU88968.1 zinc ABC transporter substrate-binding protein [Spirochaetota bacterium]